MKNSKGFTLIEVLIVLVIISVLLGVGLPALSNFTKNNQVIAATNDLLSAIHVARSEAIRTNSKVTICESNDAKTCSTTGSWKKGWVAFIDADGNGSGTGAVCTAAGTDCLLRINEGFDDASNLTVAGVNANNAAIQSFTFTSRGIPKNANGVPQSGVFSVCGENVQRAVILGLSGRVRISDNAGVISCP